MQKFIVGPVTLVIAVLPAVAIAQTTNPNSQGIQSVQPASPNVLLEATALRPQRRASQVVPRRSTSRL